MEFLPSLAEARNPFRPKLEEFLSLSDGGLGFNQGSASFPFGFDHISTRDLASVCRGIAEDYLDFAGKDEGLLPGPFGQEAKVVLDVVLDFPHYCYDCRQAVAMNSRPAGVFFNYWREFNGVERCDECELFEGDIEAGIAVAGWLGKGHCLVLLDDGKLYEVVEAPRGGSGMEDQPGSAGTFKAQLGFEREGREVLIPTIDILEVEKKGLLILPESDPFVVFDGPEEELPPQIGFNVLCGARFADQVNLILNDFEDELRKAHQRCLQL